MYGAPDDASDDEPFSFLTDPAARWNKDQERTLDQRLFRVLTLEGDGVRPLNGARVLAEIETRAGRPAHELFDIIVSSSGAALLGLGLVAPESAGSSIPRLTSERFSEQYSAAVPLVYRAGLRRTLRSGFGLLGPRLPSEPLERVCNAMLGDLPLSRALRFAMVPCFDRRRLMPLCFTTDNSAFDAPQAPDAPMWQAAAASASLPGRFPGQVLSDPTSVAAFQSRYDAQRRAELKYDALERVPVGQRFGPPFHLHGGQAANGHPGIWALHGLERRARSVPVLMVSIGDGAHEQRLSHSPFKELGFWTWGVGRHSVQGSARNGSQHAFLDMHLNGQWQDPHDRDVRGRARVPGETQTRVVGTPRGRHFDGNQVKGWTHRTRWSRYLRLQPTLASASRDALDSSADNLANQAQDVDTWLSLQDEELAELSAFLRHMAEARPPRGNPWDPTRVRSGEWGAQ